MISEKNILQTDCEEKNLAGNTWQKKIPTLKIYITETRPLKNVARENWGTH